MTPFCCLQVLHGATLDVSQNTHLWRPCLAEQQHIICKEHIRQIWTISTQRYRLPTPITHNIFYNVSQPFHAQDKKVGRKRISLPQSPLRKVEIISFTIPKKTHSRRRNVMLDKLDNSLKKTKINLNPLKRSPINPIICFFQIQFKNHTPFLLHRFG